MSYIAAVRPSPIAGTWYDADPQALAGQIDRYLAVENPPFTGTVMGLVAPHAGLQYSGPVAGHAFRAVKGRSYDLVVVASPYHQYHAARFLVSAHQSYATPLGEVEIDHQKLDELSSRLQSDGILLQPILHDQEHSLEIELPFLQRALTGSFKILPIMVRTHQERILRHVARQLAAILDPDRTLLVASTDLSHFYSQEKANQLDHLTLNAIQAMRPESLLISEDEGTTQACGTGAVALIEWTAMQWGANQVEILHYATSGDITGSLRQVVGYGAAAILKTE